jgi:small-conductance mechanosensitive channel
VRPNQINASLPTGKRLQPNAFSGFAVAKPHNAFTLGSVETTLLERPLFYIGDHYVTFLGLIAFVGLFAAGLIIARFLQSDLVRRLFSRFKIDTNFVAIVTTILSLAALIFFIISAINAAGIPLGWNAPLPAIKLSLLQIFLLVALLIAVFWIASRTKRFLFNRLLAQSGLDRSLQYAIAQIVGYVVLIIGIVIVLDNAGIHLGALTVFAGAVGVGVGFGLRNIVSDLISGLVLLAERPITIGDRIEVEGIGHEVITGQVQQIRARSTVIRTNDDIFVIVPNTNFIHSPVTNWHYGSPRVRFRLPVGVAYGSNVNKVRDALIAAAREHKATLDDPEPNAYLEKFGDSTIDFELIVWSKDMSYKPRRFKSDLNYLIYKHLTEAGIEIPNPQRDIHIRDGVIKVKTMTDGEAVGRSEE